MSPGAAALPPPPRLPAATGLYSSALTMRAKEMSERAREKLRRLLVDALSPYVAVDLRQPARRVLETALRLGLARIAVPAVDTDPRRPVANVEATAAVAVRLAPVAKTHVIR